MTLGSDVRTDLSVLCELLDPQGRDIVDVGCGGGTLVRALAERGARAVGIEISDGQLTQARAQAAGPRVSYAVGLAESLPVTGDSVDAVVFMRSLHHVPMPAHGAALAEARRVLRPGGALYVAEPLPDGDYFALTSMIEDELEVRAAAQRTLAQASAAGFALAVTRRYDVVTVLAGLEAFRRRTVSVDPSRAAIFDARAGEIARALARLGEPAPDGARRLRQRMKADLLLAAGD
ncbi:MAG: class I SAM-dependent methyltransferase [Actinomycetota bacterium]|nr:class I SAM-dependent methyltransferase [Actinomycetota bacterium]